ncbi:hypothetical protein [Mycoplasmopsis glycophila]|uniref:Uncharacterized protein n=1 Tax=Mycoplasmopsis glycophila TaxID=171285 RepID=A0A449AW86_9BACT|nr:hypothetical protein [Mycoplasmopsis glycophila]VEU70897.1 Uncharacterised protein [Mycoplasmopsis glycophila]
MKNMENKLFKIHFLSKKLCEDLKKTKFAKSNLCLPFLIMDDEVLFLEVIRKGEETADNFQKVQLFTQDSDLDYFVNLSFIFKMKYSSFEKFVSEFEPNKLGSISQFNELEILEYIQSNIANLQKIRLISIDEMPQMQEQRDYASVF